MKKFLSLLLALVIILSLSVTTLANNEEPEVTLDGVISEAEWGTKVFSGDRNTNWMKSPYWDFWHMNDGYTYNPIPDGQTYDIYVKKGEDAVYVGVRLNNATGLDTGCTSVADLWQHAQLSFTLSKYDPATVVPKVEVAGEMREQYSYWRMGLLNGTTKANYCASQGVSAYTLQDDDYAIAYDDATKSYTYEVAVPYSATNITKDDSAVVLSLDLCDAKSIMGANRYLVSYAAFQAEDGAMNTWESGHAACAPIIAYADETYVSSTVAEKVGDIAIDGSVSEAEWGEPVMVTNPWDTRYGYNNSLYWEVDGVVKGAQAAKLYLTNDKDNIYIALTLDNSQNDTSCTNIADLWNSAHFGFTIAQYNEDTVVPQIDFEGKKHESFTGYWIGLANGQKDQLVLSHGITAQALPAENFEIKYDEATKTWTYEVKVPISMTNINVYNSREIAVSAAIGDANVGAGANRYLITQGFLNITSAGGYCSCEYGHQEGGVLKFTLNDTRKNAEPFVLDIAPGIATPVKLDGVITDTEWGGTPVVVTNPAHCQDTWGNFWQFNPASVDPSQVVKIYVTNDSKYLYVGATIDECDYDPTCKNVYDLYKSAHFMFSVSGYDEEYTAKRVEYMGDVYEQYTGFMMGLVNGKQGSYTVTQGHDPWELSKEDYVIKYDAEKRTYTYEVRIPFYKMNVTSNKIAFSANVGAPYSGGDAANRYNITMAAVSVGGAYNWAHLNNALVLTLTNNPETGDMNVFMVVAVATLAALGCGALIIAKKRISVK